MVEDNSKDSPKELVLAAIQILRDRGAEINPYTVANEAKLPRSTIYRNAELMDLISREKAEPAEKLAAKQAGYSDRVAELEAENEELGQTIWNLEKQNEELQKDFHDAWTMGFAAGLEEANKRHARGIAGGTAPVVPSSAWPSVDRNASALGDYDESSPGEERNIIYTPAPERAPSSEAGELTPLITPVITPVAPVAATDNQVDLGYDTGPNLGFGGETAPVPPATLQPPPPVSVSQSMSAIIDFTTAAETAAAEAASGNVEDVGPIISDRVIFADPPADELSYFGEEMGLSQDYLYSPDLLETAETRLFGKGDPGPSGGGKPPARPPSAARPASPMQPSSPGRAPVSAGPAYTLDLSPAPAATFSEKRGLESGSNIGALDLAATAIAAGGGHGPTPAADVFAAQHTYDAVAGIYNVARSGPYVASEFNPLIELSWKDIEDVYNYRASTLKDYARNVPSAPTKLLDSMPTGDELEHAPGSNGGDKPQQLSDLIDPSILALLPSDDELSRLQALETAVYMSDEETDVIAETSLYSQGKQDPDATGDRMQAMVGYRPGTESIRLNPSPPANQNPDLHPSENSRVTGDHPEIAITESHKMDEGIVDLDAIDIFDNLDEWIDIDRLERGEDPFAKPTEPSTVVPARNDELSELIKRRIEQAADVTPDASPARGLGAKMGAGMGAAPQAAAAAEPAAGDNQPPRPKNKFIGGRTAGDSTPIPTAPFTVRQVPSDIRKACLILGIQSEGMTSAIVVEAWKRQVVLVHPDQGGDAEMAVLLNTAKDTLVRWIDAQAPKLGSKFKAKENPLKDKDKDKDKS